MGTGSTRKKLMFYLMPSMDVTEVTDSILRAATDPMATQGVFYGPRFLAIGSSRVIRQPQSAARANAAALWRAAEELTGTHLPSRTAPSDEAGKTAKPR